MIAIRTGVRAAFTAALLVASAGVLEAQERYSWNRAMAPGQTLEIKGVNGGIRAVAAGRGEARVEAVKTGRRSRPADVVIEVIEHAGGVTICAVYPPTRSGQRNECAPGRGGRMSVENNDVEVEWTVRVPDGVRFVGLTVNGDIEAENLPTDGEARTVNGSVRIAAGGIARASTVNGSIDANMRRANWTGDLRFETVNGSITVTLPADLHADVSAATVTGDIASDFPLTVSGRFGGRRINGTIGNGGRGLEMKTVNGSVTLRRR